MVKRFIVALLILAGCVMPAPTPTLDVTVLTDTPEASAVPPTPDVPYKSFHYSALCTPGTWQGNVIECLCNQYYTTFYLYYNGITRVYDEAGDMACRATNTGP